MMAFLHMTFLILLQAFDYANAATPCRRDACYSAVAANRASKPNLASRKADCIAVFRTVFDDVFTATSTRVETFVYTTQTVTSFDRTAVVTGTETTTLTLTSNPARKREEAALDIVERDTVSNHHGSHYEQLFIQLIDYRGRRSSVLRRGM